MQLILSQNNIIKKINFSSTQRLYKLQLETTSNYNREIKKEQKNYTIQ